MTRFGSILEEVRRKPYDLLDASRTIFERDYLEFNVHISDLETSVQVISPPHFCKAIIEILWILKRLCLHQDYKWGYDVHLHPCSISIHLV